MSDFSWGLFILLAVSAICIALGISVGPLILLIGFIGLVIAFRYPYFTFYLALALTPFLGFTVSIPTGELAFGKHAFGGSIDIGVAEVVLLVLLATWALKVLFLWWRRHDRNWKPRFIMWRSYIALLGAHVLSIFSPLEPDRVLALKFCLRPVLFCYLAFIALPVNFIRSKRRLVSVLSVMTVVGMIAALNGAISLFFVDASSQFIHRAHPLPMFGVPALGDNHNLLAEFMAVTVMMAFALAALLKEKSWKRLVYASALFQGAIGLLTFSRTVWLVFVLQVLTIGFLEYRDRLRKYAASLVIACLCLLPLALIMVSISGSNVAQSSNLTRVSLLEIAINVFEASPLIGGGAGTFLDRVGSAYIFQLEYGSPLDAHGFLQKLAAETGIAGLLAFAAVCAEFAWIIRSGWHCIATVPARRAMVFLVTGAGGAIIYQLFNTNYWTAKMWLPIGIALAAMQALSAPERSTTSAYDT